MAITSWTSDGMDWDNIDESQLSKYIEAIRLATIERKEIVSGSFSDYYLMSPIYENKFPLSSFFLYRILNMSNIPYASFQDTNQDGICSWGEYNILDSALDGNYTIYNNTEQNMFNVAKALKQRYDILNNLTRMSHSWGGGTRTADNPFSSYYSLADNGGWRNSYQKEGSGTGYDYDTPTEAWNAAISSFNSNPWVDVGNSRPDVVSYINFSGGKYNARLYVVKSERVLGISTSFNLNQKAIYELYLQGYKTFPEVYDENAFTGIADGEWGLYYTTPNSIDIYPYSDPASNGNPNYFEVIPNTPLQPAIINTEYRARVNSGYILDFNCEGGFNFVP